MLHRIVAVSRFGRNRTLLRGRRASPSTCFGFHDFRGFFDFLRRSLIDFRRCGPVVVLSHLLNFFKRSAKIGKIRSFAAELAVAQGLERLERLESRDKIGRKLFVEGIAGGANGLVKFFCVPFFSSMAAWRAAIFLSLSVASAS